MEKPGLNKDGQFKKKFFAGFAIAINERQLADYNVNSPFQMQLTSILNHSSQTLKVHEDNKKSLDLIDEIPGLG